MTGPPRSQKRAPRREAVILFVAAGHAFAIAASAVEEIRDAGGMQLAGPGKVKGTLRHGKGTWYVVDMAFHFHLLPLQPRRVMVLRKPNIALAIESVDRMAQISALYTLPRVFTGDERRWYRGLALVEGRVVPVVNPEAFLSKAELAALAAGIPARPVSAFSEGAASA